MTPYIGEGAEECKLTAHTLKTDQGVLWEVGDNIPYCFSFLLYEGNVLLEYITNCELEHRRLLRSYVNQLLRQLS